MILITLPKTFAVGDTEMCRINGQDQRVTWRDKDTLVIEPGDVRAILETSVTGDVIHFVCARRGKSKRDYQRKSRRLREKPS
jgi:hypothetical protein